MVLRKALLYFLYWIFLISPSVAQESPFHEDAIQLAARLISNDYQLEISDHLIYSIEDALNAISQSKYVAANTVLHKYNIKAAKSINTYDLSVIVGKKATWLSDLSQTPIHQLNTAFKLKKTEETDNYVVLNIHSDVPLNMKFVANELSVINDIWLVEMPSPSKIKSDIKIVQQGDQFHFTFSMETLNCEIDCDDLHYWEFEVHSSGQVNYLGERGADLNNAQKAEDDFFSILNEQ